MGIYFLSAIALGVLFYLVMSTVLGAFIGILFGLILGYAYQHKKSPPDTPGTQEKRHESVVERTFANLLKLNIKARTKLTETVCIEKFEEVIDLIRFLSPQINSRLANSQIAWVINRMDTEYLPKLLDPFVKLPPESRANQQEAFLAALSSVRKELEEVRDMLRSSDEDQFNSKAVFIQQRFSDLY